MKHRLQTLLKHKLQWLVLLTALLGVSQGMWAKYEFTDIYIYDPSKHWLNTSACIKAHTYENSNCTDNLIETITFSEVSGCGALYKATRTNTAKNVNGIKIERYAGNCTDFWDGSISISSFNASYYTYELSNYSSGSWVELYPSCLVGNNFSASLPSWNASNNNLTTSETRVKGTVLYKLKLQRNSTDPKFKFTNGRGWNGNGGVEFNTAGSVSVNSAVDLNVNRADGDMSLSRSTDGWYYTFYVLGQTPSKLSVLETKEDVRTITNSTNSTPTAGQDVTITATLSGTVTTTENGAQYAYILFIDGNNSVLYSMTISSSTATGTIPAAKNTAGTTVKYKIITSPLNNLTYSNANFDYLYLTASSEYSYEVPSCTYPSAPTTITASPATVCAGSSSAITTNEATGGYTYKLYNGSSFVGGPIELDDDDELDFGSVTPAATTTYTVYAMGTGSGCEYTRVGSASATVSVNALPTLSLGLSPSTVYPWDVATITATTTCTESTLVWKLYQGESLITTGAGSGSTYTFGKTSNTVYTLKGISSSGSGSSVTYTVKVDGSNANCDANQSTKNITINPKATEPCGD